MLKILFIFDYTEDSTKIKSGVTSALLNLLEGLSIFEKQIKINILSQANQDINKQIYANIYLKLRQPRYHLLKNFKLLDILINRNISTKKEIQDYKPDIIHIHTTGPLLLSLHGLSKQNIIITQHGILNEELKLQNTILSKFKFLFKALVERYYFPRFKNIIFISSYNKNYFPRKLLEQKTSTIIPNAINLNKSTFKIDNSSLEKKIIYVGAINQRKNLLLLLKALSSLKQKGLGLHLTIAGGSKEPNYFNMIKRYIIDKNLTQKINFLGWISNSEITNLLSENDFFVLPSNQETLPVSILESFSVGTPVIATNVGGIPEMIEDGINGFLFEPDNLEQLVNILEKIYAKENKINYNTLSRNALHTAHEKYSSEIAAGQHLEFYKKIIKHEQQT